jgi:hypothetical protein
MSQNSSLQSGSSFIQATPAPQVSSPITIDKTPPVEKISQEEEMTDFAVDFNSSKEEAPTPKLKIDNTLFEYEESLPQKEETKPVIEDDFTQDYESQEPPKLKIDFEPKEDPFKPTIDISSDYKEVEEKEEVPTFEIPTNLDTKDDEEESVDFDLVKCVEELGLDISLVGELITDYMDKIDRNIPKIKSSIENEDKMLFKDSIYKLKGISDNLHMIQLSSRLEKILNATDTKSKMEELEKFEKIVSKFRGELI